MQKRKGAIVIVVIIISIVLTYHFLPPWLLLLAALVIVLCLLIVNFREYIERLWNYHKFNMGFIMAELILIVFFFCFMKYPWSFGVFYMKEITLNHLGYLTAICFVLIFFVAIWTKYLITHSSIVFAFIAMILYLNYRYLSCLNSLGPRVLLSCLYGIICIHCCFMGFKIEKKHILNSRFPFLTNILILVSIGVVFFIFLLEKIHGEVEFVFGHFMVSFALLVLAISFLYVVFGYLSKDDYYTPNPLTSLIFAVLSFSIGFTFSIFVLEFAVRTGKLSSHWIFICVGSLFIGNFCIVISKTFTKTSALWNRILELLNEH